MALDPSFDIGLVSNPVLDPVATKDMPFESTPGEVAGAVIGQGFHDSGLATASRVVGRRAAAGMAPTTDFSAGLESMSYRPAEENLPHTPTDAIDPATANAKAKEMGADVKFDTHVSSTIADSIINDHIATQKRQEIIANRGDSILTGQASQFGISALVGLLDPVNIAAAFVPGLPEAFVAGRMAAAGGTLGRLAIKFGEGAAQGVASQVALTPLQMGLSSADYYDLSAGEMLRNIAIGGFAAGALHTAFGRSPEFRTRSDIETHDAAFRAATAQIIEDRPVGVAGLFDHQAATDAAGALERWHGTQERILAEADAARAAREVTAPASIASTVADTEARLAQLRESHAQLSGEAEAARAQATAQSAADSLDPESRTRLAEINSELAGVIPKTRRADLMQERTMLMEGQHEGLAVPNTLETARSEAQATGLEAALARTGQQAASTEADLLALRERAAREDAAMAQQRAAADRATATGQLLTESRSASVQNLMEREVRRFAYKAGVELEPGEARAIAAEVRTAQSGEVSDVIAAHLNALAQRSSKEDIRTAAAQPPMASGAQGLRDRANEAAKTLARDAMNPPEAPGQAQAARATKELLREAPVVDPATEKQIAEVSKLYTDAKAEYDATIAAQKAMNPGAAEPVLPAEMQAALDSAAHDEAMAKGAGACATLFGG